MAIVNYTPQELEAMERRGMSRSDWAKNARMTEAEVLEAIANDPDETGFVNDYTTATTVMPRPKT